MPRNDSLRNRDETSVKADILNLRNLFIKILNVISDLLKVKFEVSHDKNIHVCRLCVQCIFRCPFNIEFEVAQLQRIEKIRETALFRPTQNKSQISEIHESFPLHAILSLKVNPTQEMCTTNRGLHVNVTDVI